MDNRLKEAQQKIIAGDFSGSLALSSAVVLDQPDNIDARYMMAVAKRYSGDTSGALADIAHLKAMAPEYGRAFQEEGHVHRALEDASAAMRAYQIAVRYNPMLDASFEALAQLQQAAKQATAAKQSLAQAQRIRALPRELVAAGHHLYEGRIAKAEAICRRFLQANPQHVEAMRLLAQVANQFNQLDEAAFVLDSAVAFQPDQPQLRLELMDVLRKQHRFDEAAQHSAYLLDTAPSEALFLSHHAINLMHLGDFEQAVSLFDQILQRLPNDAATHTSRGHALKTWGRQDDAISGYKAAIAAKSDHGDAWYGLANLKTYRFDDAETKSMQDLLARADLLAADRAYLFFALAKALEDREDYKSAFAALSAGNAIKKAQSRYDAGQMAAELAAQARVADKAYLERAAHSGGSASADPIFIVGLPRAGSTLLEQILASHSQIDGTAELPHILSLAHKLRGRVGEAAYPDSLLSLTDAQAEKLGDAYIKATRVHRGVAPFFTDKMPNNFRHIGLIRRILPRARIIDARRNAMDCCFSGFKQLFAQGQEFSYGLDDIGRYYRAYVTLMDHFDTQMPNMILRVQYEDVVADIESQVRRVLDFLDLPFEQACVDFHANTRAVRTASSEQVRRKINTKGLAAWKPYEPWLGPLKNALGEDCGHG